MWTKAYILYSDAVSVATTSQSSFNLGLGANLSIDYFGLDLNLNRIESASTLALVRTGTRGTFTFVPATLQDGVGFGLEPRYLTNAAGTGPCDPGTPVCVYRTIFSTWSSGYLGRVNMVGATGTMPMPAAASATVRATTVGLPVDITVNGTVD